MGKELEQIKRNSKKETKKLNTELGILRKRIEELEEGIGITNNHDIILSYLLQIFTVELEDKVISLGDYMAMLANGEVIESDVKINLDEKDKEEVETDLGRFPIDDEESKEKED